jgi:hypothetical protein
MTFAFPGVGDMVRIPARMLPLPPGSARLPHAIEPASGGCSGIGVGMASPVRSSSEKPPFPGLFDGL